MPVIYLNLEQVSFERPLSSMLLGVPLIKSDGKGALFELPSPAVCFPQEKQCVEPSSFISKASLEPQSLHGWCAIGIFYFVSF